MLRFFFLWTCSRWLTIKMKQYMTCTKMLSIDWFLPHYFDLSSVISYLFLVGKLGRWSCFWDRSSDFISLWDYAWNEISFFFQELKFWIYEWSISCWGKNESWYRVSWPLSTVSFKATVFLGCIGRSSGAQCWFWFCMRLWMKFFFCFRVFRYVQRWIWVL